MKFEFVKGGPAEPLTLRDRFAIKAMQAIIQSREWSPELFVHEDMVASDAYAIADSMLKEREKTNADSPLGRL